MNPPTEASVAGTLTCPSCSAQVATGEQYCEACGAALTATPATEVAPPKPSGDETPLEATVAAPSTAVACHECGGEVAPDGYCTQCGAKARSVRDHFTEQPASWVAGVCDRGVRHSRNEDAMALDAHPDPGGRAVLVVCDGVSTSTDSDVASLAAARAARDVLTRSVGSGIGTAAARVAATAKALVAAVDAANDAVIAHTAPTPDTGTGTPASCTFVAGVVDASLLVVGWVGDSRAYWLPETGEPQLISTDDSYAADQIAEGVPRAEAEAGPQAHAITRWLGSDAPDHTPRTVSVDLDAPGWVLICSDGLWNYCSEPTDLSALVRELDQGKGSDPLALSGALVDWANAQGGVDNVTVALARIGPSADPAEIPATRSAPATTSTEPAADTKEGTHDGNVLG